MPRDGHAAWKGSSGALRASCLSPSVTALATDGSSSALGTQARRAQQKRAAPHCSHSPALLGSRGRGAAGGAALLQPRAQYLPGKPRERVGEESSRRAGKAAALCEKWGTLRERGAGVKGLQWKAEPI